MAESFPFCDFVACTTLQCQIPGCLFLHRRLSSHHWLSLWGSNRQRRVGVQNEKAPRGTFHLSQSPEVIFRRGHWGHLCPQKHGGLGIFWCKKFVENGLIHTAMPEQRPQNSSIRGEGPLLTGYKRKKPDPMLPSQSAEKPFGHLSIECQDSLSWPMCLRFAACLPQQCSAMLLSNF